MEDPGIPQHSYHGGIVVLHEKDVALEPNPHATHTEHGLTYLASGTLKIDQGGLLTIDAGTITLVPAGVPHSSLSGKKIEYWHAGFCSSCLGVDEDQPLMSPFRRVRHGSYPVVSIPKSRRPRVIRLFKDLEEESRRTTQEAPELARSLLLLLLGEVLRASPQPGESTPEGSLVSEALSFIQKKGLGPISLKDVAAAVGRTSAHVTTTVRQATGYSVGEWITAGRVAEAAIRLTHTDDSLDQVAQDVGWKDKTHFIRQFRKAHGITPAAYRRRERQTSQS